ncbi:isoprenoid synthase domain-containing protein [Mycena polygramma]|nr:isoprenoid synthase domain-containing protein [Mycena polygramma]
MYLPDPMSAWPWPRQINPHYRQVSAESLAWLHGLKLLGPDSQRALDKCNCGLLAGLAYPKASKEHLRTGCDLLHLIFTIDDCNEVEGAAGVRTMVAILLDALENPYKPRPANELRLGEATRQFWLLAQKIASSTSQKHFLDSFAGYLEAIIEEAEHRDAGAILSISNYLDTRVANIGAYPCFVPGELHVHLPDDVVNHPSIVELKRLAAHLLILNNDLVSYNKEQAAGRGQYNIVTILLHQDASMDLNAATAWMDTYHRRLQTEFVDGLNSLPDFGPQLDAQVRDYVAHLANWPRAQDCWNFESGRYFGSKGPEIQVTRTVPLLPKVDADLKDVVPVIQL